MKYCSAANKQRVLQKFIENDHEKVDRLIEIYFKYLEKVNQVDEEIKEEKEEVNMHNQNYVSLTKLNYFKGK